MTTSARPRPTWIVLAGVLLVAEGMASVRIGYPSFDFRNAVIVFITGVIVGGAGLAAWQRAPWSRIGPLLLIAAAAWHLGGFRWVAYEPAAQFAEALDLVYASVMATAVLTYPSGRIPSRSVGLALAAGYVAAVLPVPRADVMVGSVLLLTLGGIWLLEADLRRQRRQALVSGLVFAIGLGAYRLAPSLVEGLAWLDTRPLLQVGFAAAAILLARPLVRAPAQTQRVTDIVVELAGDPSIDLARDLGELVGDRDARIGFWDAIQQRYLDAEGRPMEFRAAGARTVTVIEKADVPVAAVEHRPAISIDGRTRLAIASAVELAAANARLQAEVRDQMVEVRESRRRLLLAADEERLLLEEDLFASLDPRLDELEATLEDTRLRDDDAAIDALAHIRRTRRDIVALIRGWGPPALDGRGLTGALEDVVGRASLPVDLRVEDIGRPSRLAEATLVFVASEAISNVAKHAGATTVSVELTRTDDTVRLAVDDDGRGGADPVTGTGLQGLTDRLEAVGGWLSIVSRPGHGTHLVASVPLRDDGS